MSDLITPPFTFRELAGGVDAATRQEYNETQVRAKPRASSIMNDARDVAYSMAGTDVSDPQQEADDRFDGVITAETGRVLEDLIVAGIAGMPKDLVVINRQLCIGHEACEDHEQGPLDYPLTGHPDGALERRYTGPLLDDGRKWGVEFKVKGNWQFMNLALEGLHTAVGRDLLSQVVLYGDALDWDAVVVVVLAADASAVRTNVNKFKRYAPLKNADPAEFHPKGFVWAIDLTDLKEALIPDLHKRARWFGQRQEKGLNPAEVKFESLPGERRDFPWGWSEYYSLAHKDGEGTERAPWPRVLKKGN